MGQNIEIANLTSQKGKENNGQNIEIAHLISQKGNENDG